MAHAITSDREEENRAVESARRCLCVDLHGVSLELHADSPEFLAHALRALTPLVPLRPRPAQIIARLEWVDAPVTPDIDAAFPGACWDRRYDRDLYAGNGDVYWLRIDDFLELQMKVSWDAGRLNIEGRYHFQVGKDPKWERLRRWRHRRALPALRARRFSTLLYYLVYHPLLWWLSRFDGWHVLHAGAVSSDGKAHVFAGLPGCGKSTLAVGSLAVPGFQMMSDNLLLTDGVHVRACPEELLLDSASTARVGNATDHLLKTGGRRVYARDTYRCDHTNLEALVPHAIHIVGRGRHAESRRIDPEVACARIEGANALAKEVRRCRMMGYVLDLAAGTPPPNEHQIIASLTSKSHCFETFLSADESLPDFARRRLAMVK